MNRKALSTAAIASLGRPNDKRTNSASPGTSIYRQFVVAWLLTVSVGCGAASSQETNRSPGHKPNNPSIEVHTSDEGKRAEVRMGAERLATLDTTYGMPRFSLTGAIAKIRHETRNGEPSDVINLSLCGTEIDAGPFGKPQRILVCADGGRGPREHIDYYALTPSYLTKPAMSSVHAMAMYPDQARKFIAFLDEFALAAANNENVSVREKFFKVTLVKRGTVVRLDPDDVRYLEPGYLGTSPYWVTDENPPVFVNVAQLRSLLVRMMAEIGEKVDPPPAAAAGLERLQQAHAEKINGQLKAAEEKRLAANKSRLAKMIKEKKAELNRRAGYRVQPTAPDFGIPLSPID